MRPEVPATLQVVVLSFQATQEAPVGALARVQAG